MTIIKRQYRDSYARHAAPESIAANLKKAKAAAARANREVEWLTALAAERAEQISAGTWPGRSDLDATSGGAA